VDGQSNNNHNGSTVLSVTKIPQPPAPIINIKVPPSIRNTVNVPLKK
jgi:hypothetical protein